jgi:hyperosmotically inducible protein
MNIKQKTGLRYGYKRKIISMALCLGLSTAAAIFAFTGCAGNQNAISSGQYIDDKALQLQVRDALENNPGYKFGGVNVDVHFGAVQLSGLVDRSGQKSRAGEIAKNVQGVTAVKNDITLNSKSG